MIKLITFDLDHTLWNPDFALARAEQKAFAYLCEKSIRFAKEFTLEDAFRCRRELTALNSELNFRVSKVRVEVFRHLLTQVGHSKNDSAKLALEAFWVFYVERSKVDFYPQAKQVIQNLAQRYKLIALTNGNADLNLVGIERLFYAHFNAENVGAPKPHPLMFELALQEAQVKASEAVHVGDSSEMDIAPAKAVGMQTIWANYSAMSWPKYLAPADGVITAIAQLPSLLAQR